MQNAYGTPYCCRLAARQRHQAVSDIIYSAIIGGRAAASMTIIMSQRLHVLLTGSEPLMDGVEERRGSASSRRARRRSAAEQWSFARLAVGAVLRFRWATPGIYPSLPIPTAPCTGKQDRDTVNDMQPSERLASS